MQEHNKDKESCYESTSPVCYDMAFFNYADILHKPIKAIRTAETCGNNRAYTGNPTDHGGDTYGRGLFNPAGSVVEPIWIDHFIGAKFYVYVNVPVHRQSGMD
jgi:hypothetical protein